MRKARESLKKRLSGHSKGRFLQVLLFYDSTAEQIAELARNSTAKKRIPAIPKGCFLHVMRHFYAKQIFSRFLDVQICAFPAFLQVIRSIRPICSLWLESRSKVSFQSLYNADWVKISPIIRFSPKNSHFLSKFSFKTLKILPFSLNPFEFFICYSHLKVSGFSPRHTEECCGNL